MKLSKKRLLTLFLISNLFIIGCKEKNVTPIELANQFIEKYEQHSSVSYDIDYQIKFFGQTDTNKVRAKVDLIRETSDSIFGRYIWIAEDSVSTYYNTKALYYIDQRREKIIKYPKNKTTQITGTLIDATHRIYFLNPNKLANGVNDSNILVTLTEESISNRDVWKISFDIPDYEDITNTWKDIWIDKKNLTIPQIKYGAESNGENQFNEWVMRNTTFNSITTEDLESRLSKFIELYELEEYQQPPASQLTTLPNGTTIPNLDGITYSDKAGTNLHNFLDKLTLYDVWYMDCPPCIKAIPHLNDLHNKYKNKGLKVVGVNPFNNNEKDLKRMSKFLSNNNIDYPIVFTDHKESQQLKIQFYPTFYLVDHNGKVLHSETGFNEEKAISLDKQLKEYLSKN